MEAEQQREQQQRRYHRPCACFKKMEALVREMQDPNSGIPVRSQKLFLTSVPSAFMGYDLIEWLMEHMAIEESEALNLATQLCHYGYFFPVNDSKTLVVKDDSSLYRFQSAYYWPWQNRPPDNVDYAIYLAKRTLRNKQRHSLDDYELEALNTLRKNLVNKWEYVTMQAEEQLKLSKLLKKGDKVINDSQERAYWRVHRPPPGQVSSLEQCPVPTYRSRSSTGRTKRRTLDDVRRDISLLRTSFSRTRVKTSQALDALMQHIETYMEYDPLLTQTQPSNPWVSDDTTHWQLNSAIVEVATEKRIKRWALSIEELVSDPTGLQEFTNYLRKEYSHENIRFWTAVNDLRRSAQSHVQQKVAEIYAEFLAPGAPCEINIDGNTMARVQQEMKTPTRFTFDAAQEHVYTLLLKNDCYPRFIRSDYYKNLLASGIQPSQKKRFFVFGQQKKKTQSTSSGGTYQQILQQQPSQSGSTSAAAMAAAAASTPSTSMTSVRKLSKRRGSDRSLSGSAQELAAISKECSKVQHSHSQTNLHEILSAVRVKKPNIAITSGAATSTSQEMCTLDETTTTNQGESSSSRNNSNQLQSGVGSGCNSTSASSSDISIAMSEITERVFRTSLQSEQEGGIQKIAKPQPSKCKQQISTATAVAMATTTILATDATPLRRASTSGNTEIKCSQENTRKGAAPFEQAICREDVVNVRNKAQEGDEEVTVDDFGGDTDNNAVKKEDCCPSTSKLDSTKSPPPPPPSLAISLYQTSGDDDSLEVKAKAGLPSGLRAPLAVLDADESPSASECPLSEFEQSSSQQEVEDCEPKAETKTENEVCPWEDEEACKVDAPFVKTCTTLGYL